MASIFFDESGENAVMFNITDNLPGSYHIEYNTFATAPDIKCWKLDIETQLPVRKDPTEIKEDIFISLDSFIVDLTKILGPLGVETLFTKFQSFMSFLQVADYKSIKVVLDDKIANGIITADDYSKINTTFKKNKIDLDNF